MTEILFSSCFHPPARFQDDAEVLVKPSIGPQIILIDDPGFRKIISGNDIQSKLITRFIQLWEYKMLIMPQLAKAKEKTCYFSTLDLLQYVLCCMIH
jgi:hypothetical protein